MNYADTITVALPYEAAVARVKAALADEGFGTLTEIDVQATLKSKIDKDMERYVILGACNPQLAAQALDVERQIGLLLPCNVVVREVADGTIVEALNPDVMVTVPERSELQPIADEARQRLRRALEAVARPAR